eukprot:UN1857
MLQDQFEVFNRVFCDSVLQLLEHRVASLQDREHEQPSLRGLFSTLNKFRGTGSLTASQLM